MLKQLHDKAVDFINTDTTFESLHAFANDLIASTSFENMDFLGNLGHSIVSNLGDCVYIEKGNQEPLCSVGHFTLEPHIRHKDGCWGYKHEEIYYFTDAGRVAAL